MILAIDSGKSISVNMAGQWQQVEPQVRICELIRRVCNFIDGKVAVISVGGIRQHTHAQQRTDAGAASQKSVVEVASAGTDRDATSAGA